MDIHDVHRYMNDSPVENVRLTRLISSHWFPFSSTNNGAMGLELVKLTPVIGYLGSLLATRTSSFQSVFRDEELE